MIRFVDKSLFVKIVLLRASVENDAQSKELRLKLLNKYSKSDKKIIENVFSFSIVFYFKLYLLYISNVDLAIL